MGGGLGARGQAGPASRRLRRILITRFAPAPTGFLHLGHVANALFVWGAAGALGGRVLLRVEDHDRDRCRPEFEHALIDDLEWLGFVPDEPPLGELRAGRSTARQSDRDAIYAAMLDELRARGLIYACDCSRAIVAAAGGSTAGELRYPGTCRDRGLAETAGYGVRLRVAPTDERFDDLCHGSRVQRPSEQCGDLLLKDRHGSWTYQFAAAVDDFVQRVTHVIRGDDLLASTGRQIQLARLLGRRHAATFMHHPLIMKTASQKLSKSDRATGVRDLRAAGLCPQDVIGEAAALVALIPHRRPVDVGDAAALVAAAVKLR